MNKHIIIHEAQHRHRASRFRVSGFRLARDLWTGCRDQEVPMYVIFPELTGTFDTEQRTII